MPKRLSVINRKDFADITEEDVVFLLKVCIASHVCRLAQKEYFRKRLQADLTRSKDMEKHLDDLLNEETGGPGQPVLELAPGAEPEKSRNLSGEPSGTGDTASLEVPRGE